MSQEIKFKLSWDNGTPSRIVTLSDINEMGEEFRTVSKIQRLVGLQTPKVKFDTEREPVFACRFHPTDWFHEIGCPHMNWSNVDLLAALKTAKRSNEMLTEHYTRSLKTTRKI